MGGTMVLFISCSAQFRHFQAFQALRALRAFQAARTVRTIRSRPEIAERDPSGSDLTIFLFFPLFIFRSKDHKCQREKYENKGFKSNDLVSNRGNHVVVFFIGFSGLLLVSIS